MSASKFYGKISEADQANLEARRKTRKRITIISVSAVVLVCIVVATVVGTTTTQNSKDNHERTTPGPVSIKATCDVTLYKDTCYRTLGPAAANLTHLQPEDIFKLSIKVVLDELTKVSNYFSDKGEAYKGVTDKMSIENLNTCAVLLDLAIDNVKDTYTSANATSILQVKEDLMTWLSSAGTNQQTCIDSFEESNDSTMQPIVQNYLKNSTEVTSNCLAIITWLSRLADSIKLRRLLTVEDADDMPDWLSKRDRMLLESSELRKKADIVVAKDGSGKYTTIADALKKVDKKSKKRTIIYVKKGVYKENVRVEKKIWNVLMVGDGMDSTTVTGSLNFVDGTATFKTATFSVFGKGFIARDMGIRNTAGAAKHQAVALMSSADHSVFYKCSISAFQDTLYAHAQRQFYRQCDIYGTVDFIFGNSAVVIQQCNIFPRPPMKGQQITITAQGKKDPNQNTGISIQRCNISSFGDLTGVKTFLGRPWKDFSTTVIMQSFMASFIDPKGWLPWVGDSAPDTIFYAEYANVGPGSPTNKRVKWKGLRFITKKQAEKFTVKSFIDGKKWLPDAGVSFGSGL